MEFIFQKRAYELGINVAKAFGVYSAFNIQAKKRQPILVMEYLEGNLVREVLQISPKKYREAKKLGFIEGNKAKKSGLKPYDHSDENMIINPLTNRAFLIDFDRWQYSNMAKVRKIFRQRQNRI